MNKGKRAVISLILFIGGGLLMGYGLMAIDFAFGDDRWSMTGDRTSHFPLLGQVPTITAFYMGMTATALGLVVIMIACYVFIANYSTAKAIPFILGGIVLIAWGTWGLGFSFSTAGYRITHGIDEVQIPCLGESEDSSQRCVFTALDWLYINFGLIIIGFIMVVASIAKSRWIRVSAR